MSNSSSYEDIKIALQQLLETYNKTKNGDVTHLIGWDWVTDNTRLNELNMNQLNHAVNKLFSNQQVVDDAELQALKLLLEGNAGWKSKQSIDDSAEVFNDYDNNIAKAPYSHAEGFKTIAGDSQHVGIGAHSEGAQTYAEHNFSHAEGIGTVANGIASHAEGSAIFKDYGLRVYVDAQHPVSSNQFYLTYALVGYTGHERELQEDDLIYFNNKCCLVVDSVTVLNADELYEVKTKNNIVGLNGQIVTLYANETAYLVDLNNRTQSSGLASHAEGFHTLASGKGSHSEGCNTQASGESSHSEGSNTIAIAQNTHSEGKGTIAKGLEQHVQGRYNVVDDSNKFAHIIGNGTSDSKRSNAHTVDWTGNAHYTGNVTAKDHVTKSASLNTVAKELKAETDEREKEDAKLLGKSSDSPEAATIYGVRNKITQLFKKYIYDEDSGEWPNPNTIDKLVEIADWLDADKDGVVDFILNLVGKFYKINGETKGEVFNDYNNNVASGSYSHAEGFHTQASGKGSHSEGISTSANGAGSHAEGIHTSANSAYSHAEGYDTVTDYAYSHAEGKGTQTMATAQHVQGTYNIPDGSYAHIVGNGDGDKRSNAHTLDWDGNAWYAGNIVMGGTDFTSGYRIPRIYSGTGIPNKELGMNGDIYIMYKMYAEE